MANRRSQASFTNGKAKLPQHRTLEEVATSIINSNHLSTNPEWPAIVNLAFQTIYREGDASEALMSQGMSANEADDVIADLPYIPWATVLAEMDRIASPSQLENASLPELESRAINLLVIALENLGIAY